MHRNWKGDNVTRAHARTRAYKYPLTDCEECGKPATDRHHKDDNTKNNARSNIAILCRRCHMITDGRLERLRENARLNAIRSRKPTKACENCGHVTKRRWKGLCDRCHNYRKRTGENRPSVKFTLRPNHPFAITSPCPICSRETRLKTKGRCVVCYNFWRINGRDREKVSFRVSELSQSNRHDRRRRTGK